MRYVFYAFAVVAASLVWINNTGDGERIKRKLTTVPEYPDQLY